MTSLLVSKRESLLALLLTLTVLAVQAVNPLFLAGGNIRDLLIQLAPFALIASGMTFVIAMGEIDISVGSMAGLLSAVLGLLVSRSHAGLSPGPAAVIVVLVGSALGLVNGLLVAYGSVPSIIVTLGMLTVLKGVTEVTLDGKWITDMDLGIRFLGTGRVGEVPVPVIVAAVVVGILCIVATMTPIGRRIYACGSNLHAAELRGLPVRRIKLAAFTLLGSLTALAALVSVPQLSVVESGFGNGWELFVVTCVVVGGVSIKGGKGTIVGAVLGVLLLGIVRTVLVFAKLGDQAVYWERSIQGAFILAAVLADRFAEAKKSQGAIA